MKNENTGKRTSLALPSWVKYIKRFCVTGEHINSIN